MQIRFSSRKDSKSTVYNVLIKIDPKHCDKQSLLVVFTNDFQDFIDQLNIGRNKMYI
jgi:hypothetical protein